MTIGGFSCWQRITWNCYCLQQRKHLPIATEHAVDHKGIGVFWSPELKYFYAVSESSPYSSTKGTFIGYKSSNGFDWESASLYFPSTGTFPHDLTQVNWSSELRHAILAGNTIKTAPDAVHLHPTGIGAADWTRWGVKGTLYPQSGDYGFGHYIFPANLPGGTRFVKIAPNLSVSTVLSTTHRGGFYDAAHSSKLNRMVFVGASQNTYNGRRNNQPPMYTNSGNAFSTGNLIGDFYASADVFRSVCWSEELELFVAVGGSAYKTVHIMTSSDGINWSAAAEGQFPGAEFRKVMWLPEFGAFVAFNYRGDDFSQRAIRSADGVNWEYVEAHVPPTINDFDYSPERNCFVISVEAPGSGESAILILRGDVLKFPEEETDAEG